MKYAVRRMRLEDLPQVVEMDQECFPTLAPSVPYRSELLYNRLADYLVAWETDAYARAGAAPADPPRLPGGPSASAVARLARQARLFLGLKPPPEPTSDRLLGFLGISYMMDEAHITTIGVRAACRRLGVGELLLLCAIRLAQERNERVVTLEVRVSNIDAQALYQKYGFHGAGIRKHYYSDNREDALIMTTDPISSDSYQQLFQERVAQHAARWGVPSELREPSTATARQ